jgi:TonB-linked SusC/RagA family outer membrane protein
MKQKLLFCFFLLLTVWTQVVAQEKTVTGRVTDDETKEGIPGVSVFVKGTSSGTVTDAEGNYQIKVPESATLVFQAVGYGTREVLVGAQSQIDMPLLTETKALGEVVVTALGIERDRKSLGYSVASLNNEELTIGRTTNIANALSGKVAGVRVTSSNGMVGSGASIFIRGFTSFTASNQPLFVVDGIPVDNGGGVNALQTGVSNSNRAIDINQDDIESVNVLKGPAASVLYGSRAAAGAVIITTKKGKSGQKKSISFNTSYNVVEANRLPDYQNEYAQGSGGVFTNPAGQILSWGPRATGQTVTNFRGEQEALTIYPDNVKDIFKKGYNFQNNISFSGGTDKSNYVISYGNVYETGILDNNQLTRHNFRVNGNTQITKKLSAGLSVQYINNKSTRTQIGNQLSNPFFRGWFIPRSINLSGMPFEDAAGNQIHYGVDDNPYWTIKHNKWNDEINRIIGNVNLNYEFNSWLSVDYKLGVDFYSQIINTYDQVGARGQANHAVGGVGAVGVTNFDSKDTYSYLNFTLKRKINDQFNITAIVGNEVAQLSSASEAIVGANVNIRDFRDLNNTTTYFPSDSKAKSRLIGVYADIAVGYKDFLTLNLTGRNDWSSTFGKEQRSYFYPSVAASFIFTEAFPVLKNNVLTSGKLRSNIATVGRTAPIYSTDTYFGAAGVADGFGPNITYPFNGLGGRTLSDGAGNPLLGPEFTTSFEIGTELNFFNGRFGIDFTWFSSKSTDIIFSVPISASSGFTSAINNAGVMETKGIELLLTGQPIKTKDFVWDISINFTKLDPKVKSLANGVTSIFLGGFTTPQARLEAGQPYGVLFGSVFNRHSSGKLLINSTTGLTSLAPANGRIGNPNPDWTAGITNTFNYKGISLSFLIDIRQGGDVLSRNIGDLRRTGVVAETAEFNRFEADGTTLSKPYIIDGVFSDGTPNNIPVTAQAYWGNIFAFGTGESYVFDASWVRLREASISYAFPKSLLDKTFLGGLEIGVNGRNLLLSAPNFPHFDPETNALGVSNGQGLEYNALPNTRTYGFFLKAKF